MRFLGPQPVERMASLMAVSDVQLVSLKDLPLFHHTLPSKLQAAMACAKPVIVSAPGDAADLVRRSKAGIAVAPGDPRELALAMRRMYRHDARTLTAMGRAGRQFYLNNMSSQVGSTMLASLVRDAVKENA